MGLEVVDVTQRTYSHLERLGRKPAEYDIASTDLLYYVERGFAVNTPLSVWYERYQRGSRLTGAGWDAFRDPRETTYARYTEIQRAKEAFVDGLFAAAEASAHDARLSPEWLATLRRVLPPLRYPVHGLQMVSAYVGHMAPSGRIVIASAFQTADELRRVQRLAYRTRQLMDIAPAFAADAARAWQEGPEWQPTRAMIERLLVTYDWGEAFVALNLVCKPRFDAMWLGHLATLARRAGDDLLAQVLFSLGEDARWHREWSRALARTAIEAAPSNRAVIAEWVAKWRPTARAALSASGDLLDDAAAAALEAACDADLDALGVSSGTSP